VAASSKIALQAVGLANATALGKLSETNGSLDRLISMVSNQVDTFKVSWQFNGTRHFIDTSKNEHLATHRDWLLSLFCAAVHCLISASACFGVKATSFAQSDT